MTSLFSRHLHLEQGQPVPTSFLSQLAKQHCDFQKNEQVQQANLFRRQTSLFHFSTHRPNSLKHLSHLLTSFRMQKTTLAVVRSLLLSNTLSTMSKLLTPNMYWWSRKTLVTIHWMYLTFAQSLFVHRKWTTTLFFTGSFFQQLRYIWSL